MAAAPAALTAEDVLEVSGEDDLRCVTDLVLRHRGIASVPEELAASLVALKILSLSHNLLSTLGSAFGHLRALERLNVGFNALTSLQGIENCVALTHLYAPNNRIRDMGPLSKLTRLETVCLLRNSVPELKGEVVIPLLGLTRVRELDLAGNPCATSDDYAATLANALPSLETLDGDPLDRAELCGAPADGAAAPPRRRDDDAAGQGPAERPASTGAQEPGGVILEYIARDALRGIDEGGGIEDGTDSVESGGGRRAQRAGSGSFASRLRAAAAHSSAAESLQRPPSAARPPSGGAGATDAGGGVRLPSGASPQEIIRALVRAVEALKKQRDEALVAAAQRTEASGSSADADAAGAGPAAAGGDAALRRRVEALEGELKVAKLELKNMYWLQEENKDLKRRLAQAEGRG